MSFEDLVDGFNLDHGQYFCPGYKAAAQHRAPAPSAKAGLSKADVHALAERGLVRVLDKPRFRLPLLAHGLGLVGDAGVAAHDRAGRGFAARAGAQALPRSPSWYDRAHRDAEEERPPSCRGKMKAMAAVVRAAGSRYVSLDCEGYCSGSMDEVLPIEVLTGFAK